MKPVKLFARYPNKSTVDAQSQKMSHDEQSPKTSEMLNRLNKHFALKLKSLTNIFQKKIYKRICYLAISILILTISNQKVAAETIVLAAAADSIPTSYLENGKQTGILIDVINEAFNRAGYTVEIQLMPWARCLKSVKSGDVDGIFSAYLTDERQEFMSYTSEVLITQVQAFFVSSNSTVTYDGDLTKLVDKSIGVINHTSYGPKLDAALAEGLFSKIDVAQNSKSNVRKLLAGRVDLIPSYRHVVLSTAKSLGEINKIRQLSPNLEAVPSYLAFTRKRDFTQLIADYNKALASMKEDGTYDMIFNKYLQ
ncbi:substrate-binding periplasmic protein [Agarivorans sp. QJM3NY_29]|uniref:substrate-binding periplasmic protein n=1 Tax=unclassified Agarivorans TaxID=2636026 RepID=UPI003D7EDDFC